MRHSKKWIDSGPEEPVWQIASRVLRSRLERLWNFLGRAVSEPASETENVHQLRVFTRRSTAALEIFEPWLPAKRGNWVRKRVSKVRKAAGAARDLDVLQLRLQSRLEQTPSNTFALLLEHVRQRRREAQRPIVELHEHLVARQFDRKLRKFVKRIERSRETSDRDLRFDDLARRKLAEMVVPYLEAAGGEMNDPEALHAFRIQGKQVRYAMEIFAGAFDAEFRQDLYPLVAMLQDRLGTINDHATAETFFAAWREEADSQALREALQAGIDDERRALAEARQDFLAWWAPWRRDDLRRRFGRYVALDAPRDAERIDEAGC